MAIRATDDEALATQLWGDAKEWDEDRKQYVPIDTAKVQAEANAEQGNAVGNTGVDQGSGQNLANDDDEDDRPYSEWTPEEINEELKARQLPVTGNSAAKVKRLEQDDANQEN